MISKNQITFIKSLTDKKFRLKYRCFAAEGNKICTEILNSNWDIETVYATPWYIEHFKFSYPSNKINVVSKLDIEKISQLFSPTEVVVIAKIPEQTEINFTNINYCIALDGIQDPGNFGTIIRTADWFGIKHIFASEDCADVFNSKTIQATMGSFLRVPIYYTDLNKLIINHPFKHITGAVMNGVNLFHTKLENSTIIILGNEGKGIREPLLSRINNPITIPGSGNAESLNVAVAAGIICSHYFK